MISFVTGDATLPNTDEGVRVICHVCNNLGAWGAGFVLALSKRWPQPELVYTRTAEEKLLDLGSFQLVNVAVDLFVANLIAQDGFPGRGRPCALDYDALEKSLRGLSLRARPNWSFHMPRIGCGIAGGRWREVEQVIERTLGQWPVNVYDLP